MNPNTPENIELEMELNFVEENDIVVFRNGQTARVTYVLRYSRGIILAFDRQVRAKAGGFLEFGFGYTWQGQPTANLPENPWNIEKVIPHKHSEPQEQVA